MRLRTRLIAGSISLLALIAVASPAAAAWELVQSPTQSSYPKVAIYRETATTSGATPELVVLSSGMARYPTQATAKIESEAGGTCTVLFQGRDVSGSGEVTIETLTVAGTQESLATTGVHAIYLGTVSGTCTSLDFRIKLVY